MALFQGELFDLEITLDSKVEEGGGKGLLGLPGFHFEREGVADMFKDLGALGLGKLRDLVPHTLQRSATNREANPTG